MDKSSPENYHVKSKTKVLITSMKTTLHVNHCNISSSGVIGLWLWGGKLGGAQCGVCQICEDKGKVDGGSFNKEQFQAAGAVEDLSWIELLNISCIHVYLTSKRKDEGKIKKMKKVLS